MTPGFMAKYHPLTSRPFLKSRGYEEFIPCKALRPYVACFWSSEGGKEDKAKGQIRVIPDTCVDIIIEINHSKQTMKSRLCGIQDYSVMVNRSEGITCFAVRFYFWAVHLFLNVDMSCLSNQSVDLELVCPGCLSAFEELLYCQTLEERIAWMESYLMGIADPHRYNPNLYNAIDVLLCSGGSATVRDICSYSTVSQRQMERLFKQEIGISIKRTASLVRYQNVWRDVVWQKHFHIQEAVFRYGYADQSHLLHEFKRFHGLRPDQARKEALINR